MHTFQGKKALVTGAASGIGRAIALALAKEGTALWLLDLDEAALATTAQEAKGSGVDVVTGVCDLADPRQISAAVRKLLDDWGGIDILVNSAGVLRHGPMHKLSSEDWNLVMSVNLLAPIQLVSELLATLRSREDAHVLNVCSAVGLLPYRRLIAYQTSKFGLVGFTQALRTEFGWQEFGVTALCPGMVRTPLLAGWQTTKRVRKRDSRFDRLSLTPETVAAAALVAMRKNKGVVVLPRNMRVAWRMARLFPRLFDWLVAEAWRKHRKPRQAE